jgi:hypothetical protein
MRRQTLRKPRSSTRHDHRSSTLTDAIQIPKKTLIPAALSLSLSLTDTYYTPSKGALEGGTTGTKMTVINLVP